MPTPKFAVTGLRQITENTWSYRLTTDPPHQLGPIHIASVGPRGGLVFHRTYPPEWRREIARAFTIALLRDLAEQNGFADKVREPLAVLENAPLPEGRS